jgi:hypothetical protein
MRYTFRCNLREGKLRSQTTVAIKAEKAMVRARLFDRNSPCDGSILAHIATANEITDIDLVAVMLEREHQGSLTPLYTLLKG